MIKTGADIIAGPLMLAINYCLCQAIIPDNAKTVSAVPLAKGKPYKNGVLNYRLVRILNVFSKIYKKVIKKFSVFILISISFLLYQRIEKVEHSTGSDSFVGGMKRD